VEEPKKPWHDVKKCRQFFDSYASAQGFDPLDVSCWYSVNLNSMRSAKGGHNLASQNGGWKKALQLAYPELTFQKWLGRNPE